MKYRPQNIIAWFEENQFRILVYLILTLLLFNIVYAYTTPFEKVITIDEKYTYAKGSVGSQSVSDKEGVVYAVKDSLYYFHFQSAEVFNKLNVDSKYKISGYGRRVPVLGLFPIIIKATSV